jgi:hypothetical protein
MSKQIVFMPGWGVPKFITKSRFGWDDAMWSGYNRVYLPTLAPKSDAMVHRHLSYLKNVINSYDNPIVMGSGLGAWWLANLACQPEIKMKKIILFNPFINLNDYAIFNASPKYYPYNRITGFTGPHKVLICHAHEDIWAAGPVEIYKLMNKFNAIDYKMKGGHFIQDDHKPCLEFIKDWIEID